MDFNGQNFVLCRGHMKSASYIKLMRVEVSKNNNKHTADIDNTLVGQIHESVFTNCVCLHYKSSSWAVLIRHSKVYANSISQSLVLCYINGIIFRLLTLVKGGMRQTVCKKLRSFIWNTVGSQDLWILNLNRHMKSSRVVKT